MQVVEFLAISDLALRGKNSTAVGDQSVVKKEKNSMSLN